MYLLHARICIALAFLLFYALGSEGKEHEAGNDEVFIEYRVSHHSSSFFPKGERGASRFRVPGFL